jgi:hypothetical protein
MYIIRAHDEIFFLSLWLLLSLKTEEQWCTETESKKSNGAILGWRAGGKIQKTNDLGLKHFFNPLENGEWFLIKPKLITFRVLGWRLLV